MIKLLGGRVHCTRILAEFQFEVIAPWGALAKNVALDYDVRKISAGCLVVSDITSGIAVGCCWVLILLRPQVFGIGCHFCYPPNLTVYLVSGNVLGY